jgi:DNA polymerase III alpha subunit (gram-positive type)
MITYIGLDGEMSSADIHTGGKLIQIGMAKMQDGKMISIASMLNPGSMEWSEEAEAVHEFTQDYVEKFGLDPSLVDQELASWVGHGLERRDTIAVGFNVGSFDMPFVKQSLPILFSKFSRRTVDLNALIFSLSDTDKEFQKIKANAKRYAEQQMNNMFDGFKNRQHDAEYDSVMALYCFEYIRSLMKKEK